MALKAPLADAPVAIERVFYVEFTEEYFHDSFYNDAVEASLVREFAEQIAVVVDDPGFFGEHSRVLSQMHAHDWRNGWKEPGTLASYGKSPMTYWSP